MAKNILLKFLAVLIIITLAHSVFWFFKAGQLEKHINNFTAANSANISIGSFDISGYPFIQKVTINDLKFSIPSPVLGKNKVVLKKVEAGSSIFKNDFEIDLIGDVMTFDEKNQINNVDFSQKPTIKLSFLDDRISNFSYNDAGYRIFDANKNLVYRASSSSIDFKSTINDNEHITSKVNVAIKEIEGFDIINIYQNVLEKKIIDGIKTGEVILGSNATNFGADQFSIANNSAAVDNIAAPIASSQDNVATAEAAKIIANTNSVPVATVAQNAPATATALQPTPTLTEQIAAEAEAAKTDPSQEINALLAEETKTVVKNNITIDIEYVLTPSNIDNQQLPTPINPAQIQAVETQYNKTFKINNVELSNENYKISINGQVDYFQDDVTPSGFSTVKIENASKLISYLEKNLEKIADDNLSKLGSLDASYKSDISQDAYKDFLKKITLNLKTVTSEISTKNALSQEDIAVFDMRREKNLDFIINETPLREIAGKF